MNAPRLGLYALAALTSGLTAQSSLILPDVLSDGSTEGNSSSSYPWNRADGAIRVQYIYDSSHFTNNYVSFPILIDRMKWRANGGGVSSGGIYANAIITAGEAAVDFAAPSTTFDQNYVGGVQPSAAYTGPITVLPAAGTIPNTFYVDVILQNPVRYDPASGNDLVIEMQIDAAQFTGSTTALDVQFNVPAAPSDTTRIFDLSDWTAATGTIQADVGLCCELSYIPATGLFPSFSFGPRTAGPGETVQFTDRSFSSDPVGIHAWMWDFDNDGTIDSSAQHPTTSYSSCGPTTVALTVADATGTQTFTGPGPTIGAPAASFATATATPPPFTIAFTDTSSNAPDSWAWDFDDDGVVDSTMQNPTFTFPGSGDFTTSLMVSNACGTDTVTRATAVVFQDPTLLLGRVSNSGAGCPAGSPLTIGSAAAPIDGSVFSIDVTGIPAAAIAGSLLFGPQTTNLPLDLIGAPGCSLLVQRLASVGVVPFAAPAASLNIRVGSTTSAAVMADLHAQAVAIAPGANALGVLSSDLLTFRTGNADVGNPATVSGIVVHLEGADSNSGTRARPFFNIYNNAQLSENITAVTFSFADGGPAVAGLSYFDVDGNSAANGEFDLGNSTVLDPAGCRVPNAYIGTDIATGLVYANTDPSACDPMLLGATTGWVGGDFDATTAANPGTVRFEFTNFPAGAAFQFNADIDGGPLGANGLHEVRVSIETDVRGLLSDTLQVVDADTAIQVWDL